MKRFSIFLLLSVFVFNLSAEISVKSFRKLDNDMTARIDAPKKDQNGDVCAIIKVVTTQSGFLWEPDGLGIMSQENKGGEYWLYVPYGAKRLTIKHPQLGVLRDYMYTMPIEKACVYEMVMTTGKVITTVEEDQIATEWVVITSEPAGADVYIDDKSTGMQTPYTKQWPVGAHTYRLNLDMYHADGGKFDLIANAGKVKVNSVLKPTFGKLQLTSTPDSGASISIDGTPMNQTTPCTIDKVRSGQHTLTVSKPLYHDLSVPFTINDMQTTTLQIVLKPAYGSISLNSLPENGATVTLDDLATGKVTPCTLDKVKSGEHTVLLRREWYAPIKKQLTVNDSEKTSLDVTLSPLYGEVKITTLADAELYIDNAKVGAGSYTGRLNEGVYTIDARKPKYTTDSQKIQIAIGESKTIALSPKAQTGTIEIESTPIDAVITLNGENKGTTPATLRNLLVGEYDLTISLPNYASVTKKITISEGKTQQLNETLSNGRAVTINSTPIGVNLFIDGVARGKTPYSGSLTFGNHVLRIEKDGKKEIKTVPITQVGGETIFTLRFESQIFTENVNGARFDMIVVKGGTFNMSRDKRKSNENPDPNITLGDYAIGKTEVTQAIWKAVMGNNPSNWKDDNLPIETVSWDDIQDFIIKLNQLTGKTYRLPSEAEWEYAARGGATDTRTTYAGSNNVADVAWMECNSTHTVAGKQPNELGLYDLSGNVMEWCSDWHENSSRVCRGGSWNNSAYGCQVNTRYDMDNYYRSDYIGFRLAVTKTLYDASSTSSNRTLRIDKVGKKAEKTETLTQTVGEPNFSLNFGPQTTTETVKGVRFDMLDVKGGTFSMGSETGESDEKPVHNVILSDFAIGKTEVTQALWKAVMTDCPRETPWNGDNMPLLAVSWDEIQAFIAKLNQITNKSYRLPSEAEWEYAASGGASTNSTTYAGSNNIAYVAWYNGNSLDQIHTVASNRPNELGLYDMSGNVWEWCADWYGAYTTTSQTNPTGAPSGVRRVLRGGGYDDSAWGCRVANRRNENPDGMGSNIGFRLVLSK